MSIIQIQAGGSGECGLSARLPWLGCTMRASLDAQHGKAENLNMLIGSYGHAFLYAYHTGLIEARSNLSEIQFESDGEIWDPSGTARIEAEGIIRRYRVDHDPLWPGRTLEAEVGLTTELDGMRVDGRLDRVVKVTANTAHRTGLTPGVYVCDYKVVGSISPTWSLRYEFGFQRILYPLLWNRFASKKDQARGFLLIGIGRGSYTKTKIQEFPLPTENEVGMLAQLLKQCEKLKAEPPKPSPWLCVEYNEICPHFVMGRCSRM